MFILLLSFALSFEMFGRTLRGVRSSSLPSVSFSVDLFGRFFSSSNKVKSIPKLKPTNPNQTLGIKSSKPQNIKESIKTEESAAARNELKKKNSGDKINNIIQKFKLPPGVFRTDNDGNIIGIVKDDERNAILDAFKIFTSSHNDLSLKFSDITKADGIDLTQLSAMFGNNLNYFKCTLTYPKSLLYPNDCETLSITAFSPLESDVKLLLQNELLTKLDIQPLIGEHRQLVDTAVKALTNLDMKAALAATVKVIESVPANHWHTCVPQMFLHAAAIANGEPLAVLVNELFKKDAEMMEANDSGVSKRLPMFSWADLVRRSAFMTDEKHAQRFHSVLKELPASIRECYSEAASIYLREKSMLLSMDIQSSIQNLKRSVRDGDIHPIFATSTPVLPNLQLTFPADKVGSFAQFQDRRNFVFNPDTFVQKGDVLLVKPPRNVVPPGVNDWSLAFAVEVEKNPVLDVVNNTYEVKTSLLNGEAYSVPNTLLQPEYDVFYLQSFSTQARALKAMADFCVIRRVDKKQSEANFYYSDPIRFILTQPSHPLVFSANYFPTSCLISKEVEEKMKIDVQNKLKDKKSNEMKLRAKNNNPKLNMNTDTESNSKEISSESNNESALTPEIILEANAKDVEAERLRSLNRLQSRNLPTYSDGFISSLQTLCGLDYKDPNFTIQDEAAAGIALYEAAPIPKVTLPLTDAQLAAVRAANAQRVSIIQGPPGTGKTHTIAAIVESWLNADPDSMILVTAESNSATDNLLRTFTRLGIDAVRTGAGGDPLLTNTALTKLFPEYKEILDNPEHERYASVQRDLMTKAVGYRRVVITTCMSSANRMLGDLSFDKLVIDECTQAIEPNTLVPVGRMCSRLVLIGDHKQLPPTVALPLNTPEGQQLSVSLFERLVKSQLHHVMRVLDVQHRMHPSINHFPSFQFYNSGVHNAIGIAPHRPLIGGITFPNPDFRVMIYDTQSKYPEESIGTSQKNLGEARVVVDLIRKVLSDRSANKIGPHQIAVLTAYDAQRQIIKQLLVEAFGHHTTGQIMVDSVDGAQGSEKELVIFSATRSNPNGNIGFLDNPRRMNVMLTRARRGLVVIADYECLRKSHSLWRPWVNYVRRHLSVKKL